MSSRDPHRLADVFGRLATLGAAYGLPVSALIEQLTPFAESVASFAQISTTDRFDELSVTFDTGKDADAMAAAYQLLASRDSAFAASLEPLFGKRGSSRYLELGITRGRDELTVLGASAFGPRNLADDLTQLAARGIAADQLAALEGHARSLDAARTLEGLSARIDADGVVTYSLFTAQPANDAAIARLDQTAAAVGATDAQRNLVRGLYPALTKQRSGLFALRVQGGQLVPELGVIMPAVAFEQVVRVVAGFHPDSEAATRLGELAGAFDADVAAMLELGLSATEPPRSRITIAYQGRQRAHG